MGTRGTWGLVVLLTLLLAWIWRVELPLPSTPAPTGAVLLDEPETRLGRVELMTAERTIEATRVASEWLDARGRPWPHDAVADLLKTLATLRPLRRLTPEAGETGRYALGQRRLRILRLDGSVALDLELGNLNPAQTAVYARMTGQPEIVMLGAVLAWDLAKLDPPARNVPP